MNSCARVLILKILLPSPAKVGMMGFVRPAPAPAAVAALGSAISSESEEVLLTSSSVSLSELFSAPSSSALSSADSSLVPALSFFSCWSGGSGSLCPPALCPSGHCLPSGKSSSFTAWNTLRTQSMRRPLRILAACHHCHRKLWLSRVCISELTSRLTILYTTLHTVSSALFLALAQ